MVNHCWVFTWQKGTKTSPHCIYFEVPNKRADCHFLKSSTDFGINEQGGQNLLNLPSGHSKNLQVLMVGKKS
jgi:hypothetical protein